MSLVPIIYTSLLVVSVFLIVVITVSYISFKARTKGQPKIKHSADQNMYVPVYQSANAVPASNYSARTEEQYIYPEDQRINAEENLENERASYYAQPNPSFGFRTESPRTRNQATRNDNDYFETDSPKYRTKQSDRIQIMNNTEKYGSNNYTRTDSRMLQPASQAINEFNVFKYYADNNDSKFSAITINGKK